MLKFCFLNEKTKKARQFTGNFVTLSSSTSSKVGVLCSWYTMTNTSSHIPTTEPSSHSSPYSPTIHFSNVSCSGSFPSSQALPPCTSVSATTLPGSLSPSFTFHSSITASPSGSSPSKALPNSSASETTDGSHPCIFSLAYDNSVHEYQPVLSYLCTVGSACFDWMENSDMVHSCMQAFKGNQSAAKLATARHVALNSTSYLFINSLVMCNSQTNPNSDSDSVVKVASSSQQQPSKHTGQWLKYGSFVLL